MPKTYVQTPPSGISNSGPTYEPQVTPWDRDEDDESVAKGPKPASEAYSDEAEDVDAARRIDPRNPKTIADEDEKIWNDPTLKPTYTEDVPRK
ncbi:hypothetical protein [Asticcacaulis sp. EMRT-3]|uniref:hypothetical protein n=1 Tax=Asticcacaulis sp. EMRT-3 TaxID=3040349 RepID=UPI0024AF5BE1|nr:hypothetical protein [Asticcacaulis sp. EMRT-3]MDI7775712.1 hypothetical protein [Asticcacaulis sp. EMRT-3]